MADSRVFYLLVCRECGDGDLAMPFGSPAERGKWAGAHARATRHVRWFVTESAIRLSREQIIEAISQHDDVVRSFPLATGG